MRKDDNKKGIEPGAAHSRDFGIHALLGLSPSEVERQLADFGETAAQAVAAFNAAASKAIRSIPHGAHRPRAGSRLDSPIDSQDTKPIGRSPKSADLARAKPRGGAVGDAAGKAGGNRSARGSDGRR